MRARLVACAGLMLLAVGCGNRQAEVLPAGLPAAKVARCVMSFPDVRAGRLARARLADIARYLARRPGRVVYAAHDLVSGISLGPGRRDELVMAGGARVDLLMALLSRRAGKLGEGEGERDLAARMFAESDAGVAGAVWARVGGSGAMSAFYRRMGLGHTTPGRGGDWGGTTSSPSDRVRLLKALVKGGGGLSAADRDLVLGLMGRPPEGQGWGVSAAARRGDRVALVNGATPRPSVHDTWAVGSYGRIAGTGRDLLLSVQTDLQPGEGAGIETVEGVARMIGTRWDGLTPTTRRPCPTNPLP